MCGITGALAFGNKSLDTTALKAMCDVISHRGPDGVGYFVAQTGRRQTQHQKYQRLFTDKQFLCHTPQLMPLDAEEAQGFLSRHHLDLFLGHRRLAIIDTTAAGMQPMSDSDQSVWISFNGEVYNFQEIKQELQQKGYEFLTHTDTEVLIYAYKEWGIDCVLKFNGMFAFALWDKNRNHFFLARDRYGIKPFYYTLTENQTLLFASEIKSILKYPESPKGIELEGLLEYFTFQNFFTDKTLHKNIRMLPAGHYIAIDLNERSPALQPKQYWDFCFDEPDKVQDEREYAEELERLFRQAVNRQLVSDVEIGSYLSGGMDSGSITAVAAQRFPYLKTFTVGFDLNNASGLEMGFDERQKSEYLSYLYKTEHYEMVLKSGDMERCLPQFAWHLEEPRVGQSYPNFYAAKLASKFVKVVLSGTGGDELFGGYPWRYYRAAVNDNFEDYIDKYYLFWQRLVDNKHLKQIFMPILDQVSHVWTRDIFRDVFRHHHDKLATPEDYVNHSLYFEAKTFLHGLLVVEDKLSMAHSLETRVPFLDNDLVDFAMKVPVNMKLGKLQEVIRINENIPGDKQALYFDKMNDGKMVLRKALSKFMPKEYTDGTKQGFSSPDASWFKGDSIEFVRRQLLSDDSPIYQYMDKDVVRSLVNQHLSGKLNRRLFIWSLLNFNEWCRQI